jgi:hypothetical protein
MLRTHEETCIKHLRLYAASLQGADIVFGNWFVVLTFSAIHTHIANIMLIPMDNGRIAHNVATTYSFLRIVTCRLIPCGGYRASVHVQVCWPYRRSTSIDVRPLMRRNCTTT